MNKKNFFLWLIVIGLISVLPSSICAVSARTYTTDADFDEGTLVGVEHETVHDQLQLSENAVTLPFIWVPNYDGTVSKVNTESGDEIGRYRVGPSNLPSGGNPSRTTVDLQGSCWVGNREAGTVVKVGLFEGGQCIDRNGNGVIDTSQDLNNDKDITGSEILPWGEDECVLYEVSLIPGSEGAYIPGTYPGPYDTNYWGVAPRGLAIDKDNNLWAGTWSTQKYYKINGSTGAIMNTLDVSPWGHSAYGAVIDGNGILWSAELSSNVLRVNTSDLTDITRIDVYHTYGIGIDFVGDVFISGSQAITKIDIATGNIVWTKSSNAIRGVTCTDDNNIWVAGYDQYYNYNAVSRYDNDGNLLATIPVGNSPSGVAVDAAGKVWACDIGDEYIHRIDPSTNTVDLSKQLVGSGGHYTYSDMTGIIARTITTKVGTWTVVYDSGEDNIAWGKVSWLSLEPAGTSVTVQVRSSNDGLSWAAWETVTNGIPLMMTPNGRYLQIETTLKISSGEISPILYDLTVVPKDISVAVDIKPGSCPNPITLKDQGVMPFAIMGTVDNPEFDITQIDPDSIRIKREGTLGEVKPIRSTIEDVATPFAGVLCNCHKLMGDGFVDLSMKVNAQDVIKILKLAEVVGQTIPLTITGKLYDGTPIKGQDCVRVSKK